MLFNSWEFALLLLITIALYYVPFFSKLQTHILIVSSLVFYGFHQPWLLSLLVLSILINTVSSYFVALGHEGNRKVWAFVGIATNLGILLFIKYGSLIFESLFGKVQSLTKIGTFLAAVPLPIGISFFTFQGISLIVDCYRDRSKRKHAFEVSHSFIDHLTRITFFKAFFPQLVSGPIVKAHEFLPQISTKYAKNIDWYYVSRHLIVGFFLKMVVADNMKDQTMWIAYPYFEAYSSLTLMVLLLGYSVQIFADFAGYSLIAMGVAALFGYYLPKNFEFPYISCSFSEFWRRWHISLSTWLKEYLYIPLGGNRKSEVRTYFNLAIVMVLGGLWHGAAWSYAVWGAWHGLALVIERFLGRYFKVKESFLLAQVLKGALVFSYVTFGWLLFKLPNFSDVLKYLHSMATQIHLPHNKLLIVNVFMYAAPVLFNHIFYLYKKRPIAFQVKYLEPFVYGALLFFTVVNQGVPGAFIYFQF